MSRPDPVLYLPKVEDQQALANELGISLNVRPIGDYVAACCINHYTADWELLYLLLYNAEETKKWIDKGDLTLCNSQRHFKAYLKSRVVEERARFPKEIL